MLIRKADFNRDSDVVVYLRIPKTGSSSLSNMLAELFEEDRTAPLPDRQLDAWDYGLPRAHD